MILLLLLLGGSISSKAALEEMPAENDHPLLKLDRDFMHRWQHMHHPRREGRPMILRYLQHIEKYLQTQGIKYKAQYQAGEELYIDILPDNATPLNQLAQKLAAENFALRFAGRRNLTHKDYDYKYQKIIFSQKVLYIGTWFLANKFVVKSPRLSSNVELIKIFHRRQAHFLFYPMVGNINALAWAPAQGPQPPATWLVHDPHGPLILAHTNPSSFTLLRTQTAALDLYFMLAKTAQEASSSSTTQRYHLQKIRTNFAATWLNVLHHLLDFNLLTHMLIHHDPGLTFQIDKNVMSITAIPQAHLPSFKIYFHIPTSHLLQSGDAPAKLLTDPSWQRLYLYFVRFAGILREMYPQMQQLKGFDHHKLVALTNAAQALKELPVKVGRQELPADFAEFWQNTYLTIQQNALQDLQRHYDYPDPATFTEQMAAIDCRANLLAPFKTTTEASR